MTTATRLSVGRPAELATVIPHLLGFHPHESLVLAGVSGPRRRIGLVLRVDLAAEAAELGSIDRVTADIRRSGADRVLVAVFTDQAGEPPALPHRALVGRVGRRLPMLDAVLVRAGRCWSYLCDDSSCCPPEGRPVDPDADTSTRIRAAFATTGTSVLPSREAVVRVLAQEAGDRADAAAAAVEVAVAWRRSVGQPAAGRWARREIARQVGRYVDPRARVDPEAAVRIAVALRDIPTRDAVLADWVAAVRDPAAAGAEPTDAWRRLLLDLVRTVPAPFDVGPLVLFAFAAYHDGAGVLVGTAAERALSHDPDCGMARLLLGLLDAQVHPRDVVTALAGSA